MQGNLKVIAASYRDQAVAQAQVAVGGNTIRAAVIEVAIDGAPRINVGIVVAAAIDGVMTASAAQGVIAGVAVDRVVATAPIEHIVQLVAIDGLVKIGAG